MSGGSSARTAAGVMMPSPVNRAAHRTIRRMAFHMARLLLGRRARVGFGCGREDRPNSVLSRHASHSDRWTRPSGHLARDPPGLRGPAGGATFRHVLRAFRLGAGLTQADLARRAGVPAKTVNNYQRGSRPTGRVLTKLVRVLGPGLVVQEGRAAP